MRNKDLFFKVETMDFEMEETKGEIVVYEPDTSLQMEVKLVEDTIWLSLNQMVELFGRDKSVISKHIKNVFTDGELSTDWVVAKFATTATDGKVYDVDYYNLDVIISVGYRIKSQRGVQFRIWATRVLKEYLFKGIAIHHRVEHLEQHVILTNQRIAKTEEQKVRKSF